MLYVKFRAVGPDFSSDSYKVLSIICSVPSSVSTSWFQILANSIGTDAKHFFLPISLWNFRSKYKWSQNRGSWICAPENFFVLQDFITFSLFCLIFLSPNKCSIWQQSRNLIISLSVVGGFSLGAILNCASFFSSLLFTQSCCLSSWWDARHFKAYVLYVHVFLLTFAVWVFLLLFILFLYSLAAITIQWHTGLWTCVP